MTPTENRRVALVGVTLALTWANLSVVAPLWQTLGELLGLDEAAMGAVGGAGGAAMLVAMPLWGRVADRLGARRVLIFGLAASGASFAGWGLAIASMAAAHASPTTSFAVTAALRAVACVAVGAAAVASLPLVTQLAPRSQGQAIARFGALSSVGLVGGPAFVAALPGLAPTTRLAAVGGLTAAGALLAMRLPATDGDPSTEESSEPLPWHRLRGIVGGLFVVNLGLASVDFGSSYYAVDVLGREGPDAAWVSGIGLTLAAVASGGSQAVLGMHRGWRVGPTVFASGLLLIVGMGMLASTHAPSVAWAGYALAGVAHGFAMPALQTALMAVTPPSAHGRASGASSAALGVAYVVGPVLAGSLHGLHPLGTTLGCGVLGAVIVASSRWVARAMREGAAPTLVTHPAPTPTPTPTPVPVEVER